MSGLRHDTGTLASPVRVGRSMVYEGRVARTGAHDYGNRIERRDESELRKIVAQLAGIPVVLGHPTEGLVGANTRVIGVVERAWIDDSHAAATIRIDDADTIAAIEAGTKELSLGYTVDMAGENQINTRLDHLAIVDTARCGSSCSLRVDCGCDSKKGSSMTRQQTIAALAAVGLSKNHSTGNGTPLSSRSDEYLSARLAAEMEARGERVSSDRRDGAEDDDQHESSAREDGVETTGGQRAYREHVARHNGITTAAPRTDGLTGAAAARADMIARNATGRDRLLATAKTKKGSK